MAHAAGDQTGAPRHPAKCPGCVRYGMEEPRKLQQWLPGERGRRTAHHSTGGRSSQILRWLTRMVQLLAVGQWQRLLVMGAPG